MAAYVRRYALDRLLSPDLLAELRPVRHEPGQLIIRAGDPVRDLLFFVDGRARVSTILENGQSVLASVYTSFDVLGEMELFAFETYTLNVEALTPCVCLRLPTARIRRTTEHNHRLLMYLCGRLGTKLAQRVAAGSINVRYPVVNRLASYLLAATDRRGWIAGTDSLVEIANFLGTSYRQLGRVMRRFRDAGILDRTRGRIRILDRAKLGALARERYT